MSCKKIDDVFSYLKELENKDHLSIAPESHQIQTLKFELRYVRMHLKWHKTLYHPLFCNMKTWVDDVEMCLLQSTRNGSMASKLFGGKFYNLMLIMKVGKAILRKQCSLYYEDEQYGLNLSSKDVQIEELLVECIDPLLENLKHLVQCNNLNLLVFPKDQIEGIAEKLRSLKMFLQITGANEVHDVLKNVKSNQGFLNKRLDLFSRIKRLVENATYAFCYSWAKGKESRIEKLFFDIKVKIDHIEPEVKLAYVQLLKASKIPNPGSLGIDLRVLAAVDTLLCNLQNVPKDQDTLASMDASEVQKIEFLQQALNFVKYFLLSPKLKQYFETEPRIFNSLFTQVEVLARGASLHTHSIYYGGEKKDDINMQYSNLVKILTLFMDKIEKIYDNGPKPSMPMFPQIPEFGFLDFFLRKMDELLKRRVDLITHVKKGIEVVQTELGHLMYFTGETIKKPRQNKLFIIDEENEKKHFGRLILKAAYEAEYVIDSISTSNIPNWYHMWWLSDVVKKIQELRTDSIKKFGENERDSNLLNAEKASSTQDYPLTYNLTTEEVVVGFEDQVELIIHHLLGGTEHLNIVSIVGVPGLGKTTLARKVYEHTSVTRYFDLRSWYCISQAYDRRDLLLSILADVTELSEETGEMDDKDLAEALHKSLQQRRYLIVLDDIWSIYPWDDIRNSFPDDSLGSRILFTSRMQDLGFRANPSCVIHHLRFLTAHESWELMENKVFNRRSFSPKLYAIGNDIVEKCEGLPLSIVLIAGVLRLEETEQHWLRVLESIGESESVVSTDALELSYIALELSYKYLPDYLKPCFLFLGAFPEDKEIPSWKLLRLWIAEGFVRPKNSNFSLENVAEGYLMDLIARGLLLTGQNKSSRGVKSCRVHDVLREFSVLKASEEKFLAISDKMVNLQQYRHFFYCKHMLGDMPSDPYIRSLIFFPTEKKSLSLISNVFYNLNAFDLSVLPYILKLLRVLDLEHIHLDSTKFPADIDLLVHLRYLAVQGRLKYVPPSVANLWRLETFRVVGTGGQVMLPETLLGRAYLKHLYVSNEATFELSDTFEPENCSGIEKLSTIVLRHGDCTTIKILKSLTNVRKLKCIFLEPPDGSLSCSTFPALDLLNKLESLNLTYQGNVRIQHPCELSFPSNLKKLTLSNFRLPWSEISKLGKLLPKLEVLKLLFMAFEGRVWDLGQEKFGNNLKFLKLESLDIVRWNASNFAFPCLEQLVLKKCWQLQEVPSSFGELSTLKIIQVQWCCNFVIESVDKIQEKRKEMMQGKDDQLKVLIQQLA